MTAEMIQKDGWNYTQYPQPGKDARKIVTLEDGGMVWVGIRAFATDGKYWQNNGEPERARVTAWRDLPEPAKGFWDRGNLIIPEIKP